MKLSIKQDYRYPTNVLDQYGCYRISRYLEIHPNGDVSICCYSWLPVFCGNVLHDSPDDILNNVIRKKLISDMDKGEFTECNDHCPYLNFILNENKPIGDVVDIKKLPFEKSRQPMVINFSYDKSCNLQCPSCRSELILFKLNENKQLSKVHLGVKNLVNHLLDKGERLIFNITGSGDSFASPLYWDYLRELSNAPNDRIRLKLSTNGLLMTPERLLEIRPLWDNLFQVNVSIDAATSHTYQMVRKNGSFTKLMENLRSFNTLIDSGQLKNLKVFQTNFTVQKHNYKEVKEFAEWQLGYNRITSIFYNLVVQWGHMSIQEFGNKFVLSETEKTELKGILQDDIFNNSKITLGNLNGIKNL